MQADYKVRKGEKKKTRIDRKTMKIKNSWEWAVWTGTVNDV